MKGYYVMPHPPIMVKEIGKGQEKEIQHTIDACEKISEEIYKLDVETIIIITPHGTVFRDGVAIMEEEVMRGDFRQFGAAEVKMEFQNDMVLTRAIIEGANKEAIPVVGLNKRLASMYNVDIALDHGAMVPLYYITKEKTYQLVHITYGMLSPIELYRFGMVIRDAVAQSNKKVAFIASGDLSHRLKEDGPYDYSPYGATFDKTLLDYLKEGDFEHILSLDTTLVREAGECGLRSIYILAGAMDGYEVKGNVLSYEGTFGVGYGVVSFEFVKGNSLYEKLTRNAMSQHKSRMERGHAYTMLARKALDYYFKHGKQLPLPDEEMYTAIRKGAFVSLKINGALRGCIGTIEPVTSCVGEEIIRNAISAATEDPRFSPVRKEELYEIDLSVDILHEAEPATKEELDPKIYGVIVSKGYKKGLLLPNLEGIDTVEEQLTIALDKAGISSNQDYHIQRFKVERFSEVEGDD
ncbi:MAG: AmmeMemoRadiSam system protein A [Bacillaceae bacterium]